jgi:hypothetical protein
MEGSRFAIWKTGERSCANVRVEAKRPEPSVFWRDIWVRAVGADPKAWRVRRPDAKSWRIFWNLDTKARSRFVGLKVTKVLQAERRRPRLCHLRKEERGGVGKRRSAVDPSSTYTLSGEKIERTADAIGRLICTTETCAGCEGAGVGSVGGGRKAEGVSSVVLHCFGSDTKSR